MFHSLFGAATMDKIVSIDNLIRHRMVIVNTCSMCLSDGESGAH